MKDQIIEALKNITGAENVSLESPDNQVFGDYTTNAAMVVFAGKKGKVKSGTFKNPRELAESLVGKLKENEDLKNIIDKIEVAGPGFINFWLKQDALLSNLMQIDATKEKYGNSDTLKNKKIILEFTDPNPFKEFHIGHLYTNTVGESVSRLLSATGAEVHRVNYQGDVGLHVAKAVWGMIDKMKTENIDLNELGQKDLNERVRFMGEAYALGSRVYEEDTTTKEEINILNKKIFEKDPEVIEIYQNGRKWSLEYFESIYKRLGTKFDNYYFESEVASTGLDIVKAGLKKGIFKESEGAVIFPGSEYGLHDRVFINSLGLPTYEAKELGLAPTKYKDFAYDQSIIITGNEINEYFKVLIKAMSFIYPDLSKKTKHIGHGMVRLPEGKMSSRTGKIVTGESLLNEVKSHAAKINEESSELVAIAAIKYAFLKVGIGHDVVYDMSESLSLEGNSGPYLQYTIARCNSIMAKLPITNFQLPINFQLNNEENAILRSLIKFSEVVESSATIYSPNLLCNYLYDLASKYNTFYSKYRIIGEEVENFRVALTAGTGQVLKNGLKLLGIQSPERM